MPKRTVLFVLISKYADWEPALLAAGLNWGYGLWESHYEVKTVAVPESPVSSIGGFTVIPDCTLDTVPKEFAAVILVGGTSWHGEEAKKVLPLVEMALAKNAVIGAICDASLFLAAHGFLNSVPHTFMDLSVMCGKANSVYSGEQHYKDQQSVLGGNIITAKPTGYVEFARDVMAALGVSEEETLNNFYALCKEGRCDILSKTHAI